MIPNHLFHDSWIGTPDARPPAAPQPLSVNVPARSEYPEPSLLGFKSLPAALAHQDLELVYTWVRNPGIAFPARIGSRDTDLFPPDQAERLNQIKRDVLASGQTVRLEQSVFLGDETAWIEIFLEPLLNASNRIVGIQSAVIDITRAKSAENALRASEDRFRQVFENGPVGMALIQPDFKILGINNAFGRILGYSADEAVGTSLSTLILPDDLQRFVQQTRRLFSGKTSVFQMELRHLTKHRDTIWVSITASAVHDQVERPAYGAVMIENINERKLSQAKFLAYQEQLQSLASELALSEERERRRIATNLHDRIGQTLAFAKLKLSSLQRCLPERTAIPDLQRLIEQAIADTRSLTFEISPPVLYELGLVAALEWLTRKIQQDHHLRTEFHDDGHPKPIDDKFRVVLFQAVNELCVNIVKHAQARQIQLFVRRDGDAIRIVVEDDGVGFDLSRIQPRRQAPGGFGLFNIRERLNYLGGQVKIRSQSGQGTRVTLIAPLQLASMPAEPRL